MVRNVVAVVVGLFVGGLVNALLLLPLMMIWPFPDGAMEDPVQMKAFIATLPAIALVWAIVAHLGQAFVGGGLAAKIGGSKPVLLAMIVGVLTLLGGIVNMINIGGPLWMWIEMPLYLVVALGAGTLVQRQKT